MYITLSCWLKITRDALLDNRVAYAYEDNANSV